MEESQDKKERSASPIRVVLKGLGLFLIINFAFAFLPAPVPGWSLYNYSFPGRDRFPYGENPAQSYNLTLYNLNAMFLSHKISNGQKPADEYRVILVGDSSIWGWRLLPEETLSGQLSTTYQFTCGDRNVRVYNLGYPGISVLKDLLILDHALDYQPDMVIWFVTLEGLPQDKQLSNEFVMNNPDQIRLLIGKYNLNYNSEELAVGGQGFWSRTIVGQRRSLADALRLQIYGVLWAATGIDQSIPVEYERAQLDFEQDVSFHDMEPPVLLSENLALDVIDAGITGSGEVPVIIINQPILISNGVNSELRYNYYYPRWAYDRYREIMIEVSRTSEWNYVDLWNLIPADDFTNTPFHLTSSAESILALTSRNAIQQICP